MTPINAGRVVLSPRYGRQIRRNIESARKARITSTDMVEWQECVDLSSAAGMMLGIEILDRFPEGAGIRLALAGRAEARSPKPEMIAWAQARARDGQDPIVAGLWAGVRAHAARAAAEIPMHHECDWPVEGADHAAARAVAEAREIEAIRADLTQLVEEP
jgi:hypothetical protein